MTVRKIDFNLMLFSDSHEKNSFVKVPKNLVKSENNFMYSIIKIIIH